MSFIKGVNDTECFVEDWREIVVLVNQNHTEPLMTIFLLHTKCIVKQCNFQSPAEMWTKQKVKFLELRKIIIY